MAALGAERSHSPPQGAGRDIQVFRKRCEGQAGVGIQRVCCRRNLFGGQLAGTAKDRAALARGFHSSLGPLRNQAPLKLGKSIADLIHALAHRRCGVELVGKGQKLNAALLELLKDIERMAQGPKGAVHFPDDKHVSRRKRLQRRLKPRPDFTDCGNPLILEDARAPGLAERVILQGQILIFRADPRVANSHQPPYTSRRPEQGCFGRAEDRQNASILLGNGQVRRRAFRDGKARCLRGLSRVWPRRHKGTLLIGPFAVRSLKRFRRGTISYPRCRKDGIGLMFVRVLAAGLCLLSLSALPAAAQTATQQQPAMRFLDVTARNDGWVLAQSMGVSGSNERKIVVVSYADPAMTRAFYDLALRFTQAPQNLPIFGVVRAPPHPENQNPLHYEVYFNGVRIPTEAQPDMSFTPQEHLAASLRSIGRIHFGAAQ